MTIKTKEASPRTRPVRVRSARCFGEVVWNFGAMDLIGAVLAPSWQTEPTMKEPRRKIDAELNAKIELEALAELATVAAA